MESKVKEADLGGGELGLGALSSFLNSMARTTSSEKIA
jgi:hypothetical protein